MIIGIFGTLGCGKSLLSTKISIERALEKGKKIISNGIMTGLPAGIDFFYMSSHSFVDFLQENYENKEKLANYFQWSVLRIEEMENLISARRSSSALNDLCLMFFRMCGKIDCDLIYDCQVFGSDIDIVLRELTPIIITSQKIDQEGNLLIFEDRIPKNKDGSIKPVAFIVDYEFNMGVQGIIRAREILDLSDFYEKYNTREFLLLNRNKYLKK